MNYILPALFATIFLISCSDSKEKEEQEPVPEEVIVEEPHYRWEAFQNDSTGLMEMKKMPYYEVLSTQAVLDYTNQMNPNILLELAKVSNDTVYLVIRDAAYLTQQMGSAGPTMYLSEVTYNFTELPGITHVAVVFKPGDHAQPGTFSRESFQQ